MTLAPAFTLISSSPTELFMIGDSRVNEMKDTKLTLYPSVLDDHSRICFPLHDQKRVNAVNSVRSDHRHSAHQEDGVGGGSYCKLLSSEIRSVWPDEAC